MDIDNRTDTFTLDATNAQCVDRLRLVRMVDPAQPRAHVIAIIDGLNVTTNEMAQTLLVMDDEDLARAIAAFGGALTELLAGRHSDDDEGEDERHGWNMGS